MAPIGAVVGEWVGSSGGLGYLMLHANARVQVDLMFAALVTLAVMAITLHTITDRLLRRAAGQRPVLLTLEGVDAATLEDEVAPLVRRPVEIDLDAA